MSLGPLAFVVYGGNAAQAEVAGWRAMLAQETRDVGAGSVSARRRRGESMAHLNFRATLLLKSEDRILQVSLDEREWGPRTTLRTISEAVSQLR